MVWLHLQPCSSAYTRYIRGNGKSSGREYRFMAVIVQRFVAPAAAPAFPWNHWNEDTFLSAWALAYIVSNTSKVTQKPLTIMFAYVPIF
ncbi:hypothetical protein RSOLAG1IB_12618 [Rhizoctonia solani AG-1 IB]|uniref:Uncharacterized protein n=1 Tax=Thanatephorus cucumeris (strain AG1-IB / isolate 7/3/14) TaxID=1108050 RepID=A0A0B7G1J7_THACB|nr:hypothetical protein RSOLAG1IB_12618 [Rhizoctonia solani AG-1 IB]